MNYKNDDNHNHVAILTGATGGIGKAIAQQLIANNSTVILVGRNLQSLEKFNKDLHISATYSGEIYICATDISTEAGRQYLANFITTIPEQVNMLINSAGINDFKLFEQQDSEMITRMMHINCTTPMLLIKELFTYFKQQPSVQIINVGSTFGSIGYPGYGSYCASKFALRGFTESLSREWADTNIRVRYFSPRATTTPLNSDAVIEMNKALKVNMDSPKDVASQFCKFIENNENNMYLGWPEKLLVKVNQIFPKLIGNAIIKTLPIIKKYAQV